MALNTYETLKTAIATWTHRADISSMADDFIDLAESRFSRDFLVSQQETRATTAADTEYLALPSDFLAIRNIQLNTSPVRELVYVTPAEMDRLADNGATVSRYTIVGDEIQLNATSGNSLEIAYYAKVPALSDTNTTNWLISAYPDIYLYGCLSEAFKYMADDQQAGKYDTLYRESVQAMKKADEQRKTGQSMFVRTA